MSWETLPRFVPLTDHEVLKKVTSQVVQAREAGEDPAILLDLDSTLYEVGPRTHHILGEWVSATESHEHAEVREVVAGLGLHQMGYSIKETFTRAFSPPASDIAHSAVRAAAIAAKEFWSVRFFSDSYLVHDRPYPGAVEFVRGLQESGAHLYYLTGRDEPRMGRGTREILARDGFPTKGDRVGYLLKEHFSISDIEHKTGALTEVAGRQKLVASFENEPVNLVALYDQAPDAMHVFVDTVCSDLPAPTREGLYRIRGFTLL